MKIQFLGKTRKKERKRERKKEKERERGGGIPASPFSREEGMFSILHRGEVCSSFSAGGHVPGFVPQSNISALDSYKHLDVLSFGTCD